MSVSVLRRSLKDNEDHIEKIDKKTASLIMKSHFIGDSSICDPKEVEELSIFTIAPQGVTV